MSSTFYEIAGKPEGERGLDYEQVRPLLQQLLEERFHLAYHREIKESKGYELTIAKGGAKLVHTNGSEAHAYILPGRLEAVNQSVNLLAGLLTRELGQPVTDRTGLEGKYDFKLTYATMEQIDSDQPSIFTSLEEQLGLKLEKHPVPVEMFVIDHVDRTPSEN